MIKRLRYPDEISHVRQEEYIDKINEIIDDINKREVDVEK